MDVAHPMELHAGLDFGYDFAFTDEVEHSHTFSRGETIVYHRNTINGKYFYEGDPTMHIHDSIRTDYIAIEVDAPHTVVIEDNWRTDAEEGCIIGTWDSYVVSKLYQDGEYMHISPEEYPTEHERTDLASGWYFNGFIDKQDHAKIHYNHSIYNAIGVVGMWLRCYDQFLVIDGRRINFLDYAPERNFSMSVEDLPDTDEYMKGKRYTRELRAKFMGRNFSISTIMDFYAAKDKYEPNEIYHFGDPLDVNGNYYNHTTLSALDASTQITCKANLTPIISTDVDWIRISSVNQGNKVEGPFLFASENGYMEGPVQLELYNWNIHCEISHNISSDQPRTGYIYLKNKKGELKQKIRIYQTGLYNDELFGNVEFIGENYSGRWGPWEIAQDWRNSGTLIYHKANTAGIMPVVTSVDTSGWPGLSWSETADDIVFTLTLNSSFQPRTAVIHLTFEDVPFDLVLTQEACPDEDSLEYYLNNRVSN